ncbi:MAG: hypothetical protein KDA57_16990 [Planctomycetales bacterium]|nr:hypothetical protein [Planctomycetales bacterium]
MTCVVRYLSVNQDLKSRVTYSVITKRLHPDSMRDFIHRELDRLGLAHNTFSEAAQELSILAADGVFRRLRLPLRRRAACRVAATAPGASSQLENLMLRRLAAPLAQPRRLRLLQNSRQFGQTAQIRRESLQPQFGQKCDVNSARNPSFSGHREIPE